jgi:hypothetical protein
MTQHDDAEATAQAEKYGREVLSAVNELARTGLTPEAVEASGLAAVLDRPGSGRSDALYPHSRLVAAIGRDSSPEASALRKLFGLEPGHAGKSLIQRREAASVDLRSRRPRDPYQMWDAPLSDKQARIVADKALSRFAHRLTVLFPIPKTDATSRSEHYPTYEVVEIGGTTWLDATLRPTRYVQRYLVRAIEEMTYYSKTSFFGAANVSELNFVIEGGAVDRIIEQTEGNFTLIVRFGTPVQPGMTREFSIETEFGSILGEPDNYSYFASRSPAELATLRIHFAEPEHVEVREIQMNGLYDDPMFDQLESPIRTPDRFGWIDGEFVDMEPMWSYGLAWRYEDA